MAEPNYFRLTCIEGGILLKLQAYGTGAPAVSLQYRMNGTGEWQNLSIGTSYPITSGNFIELKGTNTSFGSSLSKYNYFEMSAQTPGSKMMASGDITTMLDPEGNVLDLTGRNYCFVNLFNGCQALTDVEDLVMPSTTLAPNVYRQLFMGTGITKSPYLPATTIAQNCYISMFNGCQNLSYVKADITPGYMSLVYTNSWLAGVAEGGVFETPYPEFESLLPSRSATTVPVDWAIQLPQPLPEGFWLGGKKVKTLYINGNNVKTLFINGKQVDFEGDVPPGPDPKLTNFRITNIGNAGDDPQDTWRVEINMPAECDMKVYHSDSGDTTTLTAGTNTITLPYGEYLEFEGDNEHGLYPDDEYFYIICPSTGTYEASGQLSSLAKLDTKQGGHSFYGLFEGNTGLYKAKDLAFPTGYENEESVFENMFYGCSTLNEGPDEIPYCTGNNAFAGMFYNCMSLNSVGVKWTTWPIYSGQVNTSNWMVLAGLVAPNPTFTCPSSLTVPQRDDNYVPALWTITHA